MYLCKCDGCECDLDPEIPPRIHGQIVLGRGAFADFKIELKAWERPIHYCSKCRVEIEKKIGAELLGGSA